MSANPSLRHLEAFVAIARLGSFTKAARHLNLSQSALTVQVRQLEETLGVRLLDRNTRSVSPTRIGRELFPRVERLLREIDSVVLNAHEISARNRGIVTVAGLPSICASLAPKVVARFKEAYPGITVIIRDTVAQRVIELVKSEEADFGIGSFDDRDTELAVTHLFSDRMSILLPPGHPSKGRGEMKLEELTTVPLIVMDSHSGVRRLTTAALETAGICETPAYEVTYMSTAIGLVQSGLGAAILPSSAVEGGQAGTCQVRKTSLKRRIGIIQKAGRSLSPASTTFLRSIVTVCKELYPS